MSQLKELVSKELQKHSTTRGSDLVAPSDNDLEVN